MAFNYVIVDTFRDAPEGPIVWLTHCHCHAEWLHEVGITPEMRTTWHPLRVLEWAQHTGAEEHRRRYGFDPQPTPGLLPITVPPIPTPPPKPTPLEARIQAIWSGKSLIVDVTHSAWDAPDDDHSTITIRRSHDDADWDITFEQLQQLSAALETKLINLVFEAGTPSYSDQTPGTASRISICAYVPDSVIAKILGEKQ